jgi:hypothetical protein
LCLSKPSRSFQALLRLRQGVHVYQQLYKRSVHGQLHQKVVMLQRYRLASCSGLTQIKQRPLPMPATGRKSFGARLSLRAA